jgi:hypothetical protein
MVEPAHVNVSSWILVAKPGREWEPHLKILWNATSKFSSSVHVIMQTSNRETIRKEFVCPILNIVMKDPVVMKDGYSYERAAITAWLQKPNTPRLSPMTREPLSLADATPNRALKDAIEAYLSDKYQIKLKCNLPRFDVTTEIATCLRNTVRDLKERIAEKLKIPANFQTLKLENEELGDDGAAMEEYSITEGKCIEVECPHVQVFVNRLHGGHIIENLYPFETVMDLKARLHVRLGLPPDIYYLIFQGKQLFDDYVFALLDGQIVCRRKLGKSPDNQPPIPIPQDSTLFVTGRLRGGLSAK